MFVVWLFERPFSVHLKREFGSVGACGDENFNCF